MLKTISVICFFIITLSLSIGIIQSPRFAKSPCATPLTYHVGSIDPSFHISSSESLDIINQSARIWNQAYGQPLFVNSTPAAITVNFIYDKRSALNNQILQDERQLKKNNTDLQKQINQFEVDKKNYENKLSDFNNQVQFYNRQGNISIEDYNQLSQEQRQLSEEGKALNERATKLNLQAQNYNFQIDTLNQEVSQFNDALNEKPEAGLYDSRNHSISVYFAADRQQLIHTLTHEFGHALGMSHASDSAAVMYTYTNDNIALSPEDKTELAYVCRPQPLSFFLAKYLQK